MRLNKIVLFLSVFTLITWNACRKAETNASTACTVEAPKSHPKSVAFQSLMDEATKAGLPGMSLLIADSNGVWYGASGMADIESNIAYQPCSVQKLGSITKMMMAVMVMKLVEEGKVNIDDKVSKWLDAKTIDGIANADQVTLRNLMQHTTGIYDIIRSSDFYLAVLHNPNKHWTGEELLTYVRGQAAVFTANTEVRYSNTNTLLLSMCIEKITGRPHNELLHEKVIDPIGMTNTYYHTHDALPAITAQGYYDLYNKGTVSNVSNIVTGSGNGFTGVYSNVFDLQKFVKAVFINKTILKQSTLDTMMQWKQNSPDTDFGLGLFRKSLGTNSTEYRIGHTGGDLGYACEVYYFPHNGRYFILCVNYGTDSDSYLKPVYSQLVKDIVTEMKK